MKCGYCRVSSTDQNLDVQRQQLVDAGCERIFEETASGKNTTARPQLKAALEFVRDGDVLIVAKLDRLARSLPDLFDIASTLDRKGVQLIVLNNTAVNTTTPMGRCVFAIFGAIAEFEREIILERQREGIDRAKAEGKYTGAKLKHDRDAMRRLVAEGLSKSAVARQLGCSRMSVWRAIQGEAQ